MPSAKPRRCTIARDTAVVTARLRAPCPAMRTPTNPKVRPSTSVTKLSVIRIAAKAMAMAMIT